MTARIDIDGHRYGRLLVVSRTGKHASCVCDCGAEKTVLVFSLRCGRTRSCGCLRRETVGALSRERMTTHGHNCKGRETRTHNSWRSMRERCLNPKSGHWDDYGGRGITVDSRWDSFANFLADMGERPAGMTLDRKDNDLGYRPGNCHWATPTKQQRNTRKFRRTPEFVSQAQWLASQNWRTPAIAVALHCSDRTVRDALAEETS